MDYDKIIKFCAPNNNAIILSYKELLYMLNGQDKKRKEFEELIEKKFYQKIKDILGTPNANITFSPNFEMRYDNKSKSTNLFFSKTELIVKLCLMLYPYNKDLVLNEFMENEDFIDDEKLIDKMKSLFDQKIKDILSNDPNEIFELQKELLLVNKEMNRKVSYEELMEKKLIILKRWRKYFEEILDYFNTALDTNKYLCYFNSNELMLYVAMKHLFLSEQLFEEKGELTQCMEYPVNLIAHMNKVKENNKNYQIIIYGKFIDSNWKKISSFSYDELEKRTKSLLEKNPEAKIFTTDDYKSGISLEEANETRLKLLTEEQAKIIETSWEFIKKGEGAKIDRHIDTGEKKIRKGIDLEERQRRLELINERKKLLEKMDYIYEIRGINKFAGYSGYIYKNGIVVFEKYYNDEDQTIPASYEATYVMDIKNFIELSQLTKLEIIDVIKNSDMEVKRVFHTKNWGYNIIRKINEREYSEDILKEIEEILTKSGLVKGDNND